MYLQDLTGVLLHLWILCRVLRKNNIWIIFKQCLVAFIVVCSFFAGCMILTWLVPEWTNTDLHSVRMTWFGISGGFLGGGIYMARGFYQSLINQEQTFDFERFGWWYVFRLLLGPIAGGLSVIVTFLAFDLQESVQNLYTAFFLGILSSYNFTDFINTRFTNTVL